LFYNLPAKRSCSAAVVVLEEPTKSCAALVRAFPQKVPGASTFMLHGEGDSLMNLPLCSFGKSEHEHHMAFALVRALLMIMRLEL
jgi:hypothetical protein